MSSFQKYCGPLPIAAVVCMFGLVQPASAITADLAKKCREMALKAHPPAPAGSKMTSAKAQQDFYRACVAKNGKMNDSMAGACRSFAGLQVIRPGIARSTILWLHVTL